MAITRSFAANGQFEVVDWTQELVQIPNDWGTIGRLGLFDEIPVQENVITFEKYIQDGAPIVDQVRGARANVNKDFTREIHAAPVPHFPLDDMILPTDIQGKRAYGVAAQEEQLAAVRMRKMERIRRDHAWTLEIARAVALTTGNVYAPNGTVSQNWYTEFGLTQQNINVAFSTATTDVIGLHEQAQAYIQDNMGNGGMMTGIVALCSPEYFAALISHPKISTAYQYYAATNQLNNAQPLRDRLGGASTRNREFYFGSVHFIEMRDSYPGYGRLIPANKAYFVATGTDSFQTFFGPANKFEFVNTLGEQAYFFEYAALTGDKINIESESNHISVLRRPAAVVQLTAT